MRGLNNGSSYQLLLVQANGTEVERYTHVWLADDMYCRFVRKRRLPADACSRSRGGRQEPAAVRRRVQRVCLPGAGAQASAAGRRRPAPAHHNDGPAAGLDPGTPGGGGAGGGSRPAGKVQALDLTGQASSRHAASPRCSVPLPPQPPHHSSELPPACCLPPHCRPLPPLLRPPTRHLLPNRRPRPQRCHRCCCLRRRPSAAA